MPKKAKKKKAGKRRRGVGAMSFNPNNPLIQWGSIAAGFFLAKPVNEAIDKVVPADKVDPKLTAAGQAGIGSLLVFKKFTKNKMLNTITTVGGGIVAGAGVKRGMDALGIGGIGGYQTVPAINGYQSVPAVGATKRINGYNPGNGGMSLNGTMIPMRQAIGAVGSGSGVMDR